MAFEELVDMREALITLLAEQRVLEDSTFSYQEWEDWFAKNELLAHNMDAAVNKWKELFYEQELRIDGVATRAARLRAWRAHVTQCYGSVVLALLLVRKPVSDITEWELEQCAKDIDQRMEETE